MSAIAGVFYRDGRPVAPSLTEAMADVLKHRGPDGYGTWQEGSVGLMHRKLIVTPEDITDRQPLHDDEAQITIVADARIDNRDTLIPQLAIRPKQGGVITDAEVIRHAYLRWGAEAPRHLIGAFAFALYDATKQRLVLACDHMAIRPLFLYRAPEVLAFATEIKALFCVPGVPREKNEEVIADHLTTVKRRDTYATFYKGIYQFRPAHLMIGTISRCQHERYWTLDPEQRLPMVSEEEYVAGFKQRFDEAVRCRLRRNGLVGSTLSGGLDSSSIACTIRQQERPKGNTTHTYSCIFPSMPEKMLATIDERNYMEEVAKLPGICSHYVRADSYSPLVDVDQMLWHMDEAFWGGNIYLHWLMFQAAHEQGIRLFFDGSDGDSTVSHGLGHLAELMHQGRWKRHAHELHALSNRYGAPADQLARRYAYPELRWLAREGHWMRLGASLRELHMRYELPYREMVMGPVVRTLLPEGLYQKLRSEKSPPGGPTIIHRAFARTQFIDSGEKLGFLDNDDKGAQHGNYHRHNQIDGLLGSEFTEMLNIFDKLTAAHQIQQVYPFFDRRLMEYCVALPANMKLNNGWTRYILRKAMEDVLPSSIQWRVDKGRLGANLARNLYRMDQNRLLDALFTNRAALQPYVDLVKVRQLVEQEASKELPDLRNASALLTVFNLAKWLENENKLS